MQDPSRPPGRGSQVDPALRQWLVCPACRGELSDDATAGDAVDGLGCRACGLLYPVVDGVPWMTPEQAVRWGGDGSGPGR